MGSGRCDDISSVGVRVGAVVMQSTAIRIAVPLIVVTPTIKMRTTLANTITIAITVATTVLMATIKVVTMTAGRNK